MATMPTDLTYGKVVGRLILAIADGPDADRNPDATPAEGSLELVPKAGLVKRQSPPTTVIPKKISCSFDSDGNIIDPQGAVGVWLVTGTYTVNYKLTGVVVASHDIEVLPEHDDATPLDLTNSIPPGGPVLLPSQYAELSARIDAIPGGGGTAGDATATTKGIIQLAGDLGGTASAPTVPGLANRVPTTRKVNGKTLSADIALSASDVGAATAAQGAKADSAVQPGSLATVATTGAYGDLSGKPTLGTAAATASTDYATAAQGAKADTAMQPATGQAINAQTGTAYTLVAADAGKLLTLNNAAAITLTVPPNVFTAGQRVDVLVLGAGMVTAAAGSGATVNGTPSLVSRARYSAFTVVFISATSAVLVGDLA